MIFFSATPVSQASSQRSAFKHLNLLREARATLLRRIASSSRFYFGAVSYLRCPPQTGTTIRAVSQRNADPFLERCNSEFDTSAVPGRVFEMSDHFRIGMGVNTEIVRRRSEPHRAARLKNHGQVKLDAARRRSWML